MEDTTTKEVSGIRLHKNYIWLVAAVLVGLFGGAAMLLAVSHADNATLDDIAAARAALKSTELVPVETPDTTGFSLNILTETVGETFFRTDETDGSTLVPQLAEYHHQVHSYLSFIVKRIYNIFLQSMQGRNQSRQHIQYQADQKCNAYHHRIQQHTGS